MIIDRPTPEQIPSLRRLWQQAFGDTDSFLDSFFNVGFSPDRCRGVIEEDLPMAALYWFDCFWQNKKIAYIYAVATDKQCRGQGLCRILMENTHLYLKLQGYSGTVLVPGEPGIVSMYQKFGYNTFCCTESATVLAKTPAAALNVISADTFENLRKQYLPENSVLQEGQTTAFLATFCDFYAGEDFLLCAAKEEDTLHIQEFLGNTEKLSGILTALQVKKAVVRQPGNSKPFAMYHSLTDSKEAPAYFGIALD